MCSRGKKINVASLSPEPLGGLENSFLADPNTSLGLLGVVVLLVLGLAVAVAAALCACNSCNGQQRKGNILSHSSSMGEFLTHNEVVNLTITQERNSNLKSLLTYSQLSP